MKKSFKDRIAYLGLSYKKEMIILIGINVFILIIGFVVFFLLKEWLVLPVIPILMIASSVLYLSRYSGLEKKLEKNHIDEFISLLSYFEIFVYNGNNIYKSFEMLLPYCSTYMEEVITSFLSQMDADKSVGPFVTFASKFNNRIIESLMLSIYQMVDNGGNGGQFSEFNALFSSIAKDHQQEVIEEQKRKLNALDSWPLIGSGAVTIILAIAILNIIGDYVNVL